eukprot:PLAT3286.22.p1 GENE.PLAT3286.22~~PLAT3286.22.p1  ORF type:complete len:1000 (-),score=423.73 PLAT3286.22:100-3099(-)
MADDSKREPPPPPPSEPPAPKSPAPPKTTAPATAGSGDGTPPAAPGSSEPMGLRAAQWTRVLQPLLGHMAASHDACAELHAYVEQRVALEASYAAELERISRNLTVPVADDAGMNAALAALRTASVATSEAHSTLSKSLAKSSLTPLVALLDSCPPAPPRDIVSYGKRQWKSARAARKKLRKALLRVDSKLPAGAVKLLVGERAEVPTLHSLDSTTVPRLRGIAASPSSSAAPAAQAALPVVALYKSHCSSYATAMATFTSRLQQRELTRVQTMRLAMASEAHVTRRAGEGAGAAARTLLSAIDSVIAASDVVAIMARLRGKVEQAAAESRAASPSRTGWRRFKNALFVPGLSSKTDGAAHPPPPPPPPPSRSASASPSRPPPPMPAADGAAAAPAAPASPSASALASIVAGAGRARQAAFSPRQSAELHRRVKSLMRQMDEAAAAVDSGRSEAASRPMLTAVPMPSLRRLDLISMCGPLLQLPTGGLLSVAAASGVPVRQPQQFFCALWNDALLFAFDSEEHCHAFFRGRHSYQCAAAVHDLESVLSLRPGPPHAGRGSSFDLLTPLGCVRFVPPEDSYLAWWEALACALARRNRKLLAVTGDEAFSRDVMHVAMSAEDVDPQSYDLLTLIESGKGGALRQSQSSFADDADEAHVWDVYHALRKAGHLLMPYAEFEPLVPQDGRKLSTLPLSPQLETLHAGELTLPSSTLLAADWASLQCAGGNPWLRRFMLLTTDGRLLAFATRRAACEAAAAAAAATAADGSGDDSSEDAEEHASFVLRIAGQATVTDDSSGLQFETQAAGSWQLYSDGSALHAAVLAASKRAGDGTDSKQADGAEEGGAAGGRTEGEEGEEAKHEQADEEAKEEKADEEAAAAAAVAAVAAAGESMSADAEHEEKVAFSHEVSHAAVPSPPPPEASPPPVMSIFASPPRSKSSAWSKVRNTVVKLPPMTASRLPMSWLVRNADLSALRGERQVENKTLRAALSALTHDAWTFTPK